jgi:selenocysteine lyase/cysteine desulfurase
MNIQELHANEELRRHEFPVCRDKVFLGHAGVCPLPRRVAEAIRAYASDCCLGDQETLLPSFQIRSTRELAARLLNASFDEISFVGPTSLALSLVAGGLRWEKGDSALVYFDDYPSNVYPWMALEQHGARARFLKVPEYGRIEVSDVLGQIDATTRLVSIASCHFVAGWRPDIATLGHALRERNILFCVDAIQTVGAFPTDVANIDFLAADAHKWLLGPCAAGLLYVKASRRELLRPIVYGWHNVECPAFVSQETLRYPNDGRRYEAGTENLLGLVGFRAAMELLLEVGVDNIAAELLRKRKWLAPAIEAKGYEVLFRDALPAHASGIISFHKPGVDLAGLHRKLERDGIFVSLRFDRLGRGFLRASPHFYNTDEELGRLVEAV